jgi:hypothetical protein
MTIKATPEDLIALPDGGGAVSGLGESFSADLQTGTGQTSVPIALPPGRDGFVPSLALRYSSGYGAGPVGMGWRLDVPGISRRTERGVPIYDDLTDTFVLSGAEELVAVGPRPEAPGSMQYRPRTERGFARIVHHRRPGQDFAGRGREPEATSSNNDFWEVKSPSGLTSVYGTPRPADADAAWTDPAVLADPEAPDRILGWRLSATVDTFGNSIETRVGGQLTRRMHLDSDRRAVRPFAGASPVSSR